MSSIITSFEFHKGVVVRGENSGITGIVIKMNGRIDENMKMSTDEVKTIKYY